MNQLIWNFIVILVRTRDSCHMHIRHICYYVITFYFIHPTESINITELIIETQVFITTKGMHDIILTLAATAFCQIKVMANTNYQPIRQIFDSTIKLLI